MYSILLGRLCLCDMQFKIPCKIFRDPNSGITIPEVWDIRPDELSEDGKREVELLESTSNSESNIWELTKWTCQAILEFQDLQSINFPDQGKWFNINYLFFEGLSVLREAILCGINGQAHASFTTLRAAIEIIMTHYWWKKKRVRRERLWTILPMASGRYKIFAFFENNR